MDAERAHVDGLRRAAEHAPAFDDALLSPLNEPGRRRPRWRGLAAAASVLVVVGIAIWAGPGNPPHTATPAANPTPSAAATTDPHNWTLPPAGGVRPLVGTTWVVSRMQTDSAAPRIDTQTPLDRRPWVRFLPDGTLQGHDGCNFFNGHYQLDGEKIRFSEGTSTSKGCVDHPSGGFTQTLNGTLTWHLGVSSLTLQRADGLQVVTFHPLTPTDQAVPADVRLRLANNTGKDISSITLRAPDLHLEYGALPAGATSEELLPEGPLYSYAKADVTYADGSTDRLVPADFVGEQPLAPGYWTYVLSIARGPEWINGRSLIIGLEESGRPAGQR